MLMCIWTPRDWPTRSHTAVAILGGYDRREIEGLVNELKKTNDSMQACLKAHGKGTTANTGTALREMATLLIAETPSHRPTAPNILLTVRRDA
jgi:hypothetical protein